LVFLSDPINTTKAHFESTKNNICSIHLVKFLSQQDNFADIKAMLEKIHVTLPSEMTITILLGEEK